MSNTSLENSPLMKCGHTANAFKENKPVCVICYGISPGADEIQENAPDLTGRMAKCMECDRTVPSNFNLPFFKYRPEHEWDSYYSGCHGWN